jgi:hypothetical protein
MAEGAAACTGVHRDVSRRGSLARHREAHHAAPFAQAASRRVGARSLEIGRLSPIHKKRRIASIQRLKTVLQINPRPRVDPRFKLV